MCGDTYDVKVIRAELDNYLLAAEGEWWANGDLHLAHTDEDWGECLLDNTWYVEERDHLTKIVTPQNLDN